MKNVFALVFLLTGAVAAEASTVLVTPPLSMLSTAHFMQCLAVNLDDQPRDLTLEILNFSGVVLASGGGMTNPGTVTSTASANISASYCRITYDGGKKDVRGALTLIRTSGTLTPAVTVPAQAQ